MLSLVHLYVIILNNLCTLQYSILEHCTVQITFSSTAPAGVTVPPWRPSLQLPTRLSDSACTVPPPPRSSPTEIYPKHKKYFAIVYNNFDFDQKFN